MTSTLVPVAEWLARYERPWLKADVVAGLTTAAVVIPKAMAYATIAGLPVEVGLYTALVPMVVYAALGTSRPLSVSTTTTLAHPLRERPRRACPTPSPPPSLAASATARRAGRRDPRPRAPLPARLRRELHLRSRAHRLQGRHRPGDRRRPGAQAARSPLRQGRMLPRRGRHLPRTCPETSMPTLVVGARHARGRHRPRALRAARSRPAGRGWRSASRRPSSSASRRGGGVVGTFRAACPAACGRTSRCSRRCGRPRWPSPS